MIQDIDKHIGLINSSLAWAGEYGKESFPVKDFKKYRRELKKIRQALNANCSAAAYGESQVGKSYLMSSLLSSAEHPFVVENEGREYSFIDELNPSGGNNTKVESTGIITRFTIRSGNRPAPNLVKVTNLSMPDIILLLADSYYNDIKIDPDTALSTSTINSRLLDLAPLWSAKKVEQEVISEDDVNDIMDYVKNVIGNNAAAVHTSNFCQTIAPVIQYIPFDSWDRVFGLLWNENAEINMLFNTLISAYSKIGFNQDIYVPFDALLRKYGTIFKIDWLDTVCGVSHENDPEVRATTDIYDVNGRLITQNFNKGELSALIAELTLELSPKLAEDRTFLSKMDLLDFPGARSREKYKERDIKTVIPKMLRRGKVAYLFNKYSIAQQISSVLFCHHNDQKAEATLGETINAWIEANIGASPAERAAMMKQTNGIAPLFFIATKFNIDLARTKIDQRADLDTLDKHWNRFDTVFPEIIKPNLWFDKWIVGPDGHTELPFRNIYPLRDFYWSAQNQLFSGYSDGAVKSDEKEVVRPDDFPDYLERLRDSFLRQEFVKQHFEDPGQTWESFASINRDGSQPIINNLGIISGVLDNARRARFMKRLQQIKSEMVKALNVYYEPEDLEAKNKKVRSIAGAIRRSLTSAIARDPGAFGRIIDTLMLSPVPLRNIAYEIIVCHTDTPKDFSAINFFRAGAGVDINDSREQNITRLMDYYLVDNEEDLVKYLREDGFELLDVISKENNVLSTVGDVITKHITDYWIDHLNDRAHMLIDVLPHADEVVFMLISLFRTLGVHNKLAERITRYTDLFSESEQPNAIGDYASLVLNNFVSSVGREYMTPADLRTISEKAQVCHLPVDVTIDASDKTRRRQPLLETLKVLDDASRIVKDHIMDMSVLRKLPFWSNYHRWENAVFSGLLMASDISKTDPVCNGKIKDIIDNSSPLYSA